MGIANKFNKGSLFNYRQKENVGFMSLKELFTEYGNEQVYRIRAIYINTKSKYGDAPVLVTDEFNVNLPKHLLTTINEMIIDDDLVEAVNNCEVGFNIYTYQPSGYKAIAYSVKFVDLDEAGHTPDKLESIEISDEDVPF